MPLFLGERGLTSVGDGLTDRVREAEIPDEIVMLYQVRKDVFVAPVILLRAFYFDAYYLLRFHVADAEDVRPVNRGERPGAILFERDHPISFMRATCALSTRGQRDLHGTLTLPFVVGWHIRASTGQEHPDLIDEMMM